MTNSERESGEEAPPESEGKKKKKKASEKKEEAKAPAGKKKEKTAAELVEEALGGVAKEAKGAKEELAGLKEEARETTVSLENLRVALGVLEDHLEKKTIEKFADFERAMEPIARSVSKEYKQLKSEEKKLRALIKKAEKETGEGKLPKDIEEKIDAYTERLGGFVEASELIAEKVTQYSGIVERAGLSLATPGVQPPDWEKSTAKERKEFVDEQLKTLLAVDSPFAENWRMAWSLERFLAVRPKGSVLKKEWQGYSDKFNRMRVEHACFLGYNAAANVEALQNVTAPLNSSRIEAALKDGQVAEELVGFQKDAEGFLEVRDGEEAFGETDEGKRLGKLKEKEEDERSPAEQREYKRLKKIENGLEAERNAWLIRMKKKLKGLEVSLDAEGKPVLEEEEIFDEKKGLARIEAGRLFILLGMASGYDIQELTGGDFFRARVEHLYQRINFKAQKEGDPWWKRRKLFAWMKQEIGDEEIKVNGEKEKRRITGFEVLTYKFGGGFLGNLLDERKGHFGRYGLERYRQWHGDRLINVIKIRDLNKLTKIDFEELGIPRENQLSSDILDAARNVDEVRAVLLGHNGYLDLPSFENYLKFADLFKHLRRSTDEIGFGKTKPKAGSQKDRLMTLMHRDWLNFYKGPGKATRFFGTILTAGVLPALRPDYRFINPMRAIDPATGEEKMLGYTLGDSDGEQLRLGKSLDSVSVHGSIDAAVKAGCYSPQYAEGLLRDQIKLFKVIPGIGPVRVTQEVIDQIGVGGFVGGILLFIFAPILEFARQMAKQMEGR